MNRVNVIPGQQVRIVAPYSEVCMHMNVAGRPCTIELVETNCNGNTYSSALIHWTNNQGYPASSSVTTGEAGFYQDSTGFYTYEDWGPGDENPKKVQQDIHDMIENAIAASGVKVTVITNLGLG